jgi:hypothetical protein
MPPAGQGCIRHSALDTTHLSASIPRRLTAQPSPAQPFFFPPQLAAPPFPTPGPVRQPVRCLLSAACTCCCWADGHAPRCQQLPSGHSSWTLEMLLRRSCLGNGLIGAPRGLSSTLRGTYISHGRIPTAKTRLQNPAAVAASAACFWPRCHGRLGVPCTPAGASVPRCTGCIPVHERLASTLQQPVEVLSPGASIREGALLEQQRRQHQQQRQQQQESGISSRANNFALLHSPVPSHTINAPIPSPFHSPRPHRSSPSHSSLPPSAPIWPLKPLKPVAGLQPVANYATGFNSTTASARRPRGETSELGQICPWSNALRAAAGFTGPSFGTPPRL